MVTNKKSSAPFVVNIFTFIFVIKALERRKVWQIFLKYINASFVNKRSKIFLSNNCIS